MDKTLVIIGAGVEQVPAYERAKARGLTVVGTDGSLAAPGLALADYRLQASTRDATETTQAVQEFARSHPVHGVMTIANDVPYTVASVAQALGLPGISLNAAECASNKLLMKTRFQGQGVACPWFQEITSLADLEHLVQENPGQTYVLKPIDGRGARGVLRIAADSDLAWSFRESQSWGDSGRLMIETFIPGLQLSTESFILNGRCYTPAIAERNYDRLMQFAPYFIEDGGTIPARLPPSLREAINQLLLDGAAAMGITEGIIKGDLVVDAAGTPKIIELAARLSGGWFATHQIPEATGVDLVQAVMCHALGEPVTPEMLSPTRDRATAIRYWFPEPGIIQTISGEEALASLAGILAYGFFRKAGEAQPVIRSHPDRFGYVMTSGDNREEAETRVQQALQTVQVEIQPAASKPV